MSWRLTGARLVFAGMLGAAGAIGCSGSSTCEPPPCPAPGAFDESSCKCVSGGPDSATPTDGAAARSACDPLAPVTSVASIAAGEIVDAGTDSDGTVYVLVDHSSDLRLFVGDTSQLVEYVVLGSGQGSQDPGEFWTVQSTDPQGTVLTIEVQEDSTGKRMGVAKGPISGKGFDVGSTGDVLTPLAPSTAAAIPASSTQTFHVDFFGESTADTVVVVAPDHASSYDDFRLFLGPDVALAEQRVQSVNRTLSIPGSTFVDFTLDSGGSSANLTYSETSGTLTLAGAMTPVNTPSDPSLPAGAMFQCFD